MRAQQKYGVLIEMPVANRDSSELTRARRAMILYAYASNLQRVQAVSNTVRREQGNGPVSNVYTEGRQGACYCSNLSAGTYVFGGKAAGGGCGCGN